MRAAVGSDKGLLRPANEDAVLADTEAGIFIVADGMGGHLAGEVASDLAARTIHLALKQAPEVSDFASTLAGAITLANHAVFLRAANDQALRGMGTTVVVAVVRGGSVWIAHVGDSRIYLYDREGFFPLTQDHSLVARMVRTGEITSAEARRHPMRNVISRCVGTEAVVLPDVRCVEWTPGDVLLLCSDGLTGMLEDEEIGALIRDGGEDLPRICSSLIAAANAHGGRDNISVIVARNEG